MSLWSLVGLGIVVFVFFSFTRSLGKSVPIFKLMLLIAGLQWIVGPIIEYTFPVSTYRSIMYVDEMVYMSFIVPAYAAFVIASLLTMRSFSNFEIPIEKLKNYKNYGIMIFVIGFVFDLLSGSLPGSLAFFAFLIGNFKFAGAIILFFSEDKRLKNLSYVALVLLVARALQSAMFHDLVLWSVFFYMFWAIKNKPSRTKIYLTIFVGVISLNTLQTIKDIYRTQVWNGYQGNRVELFVGLFVDAIFYSGSNVQHLSAKDNNVRLNQGWIISAIMDEIPKRTEFQDGATIQEAVSSAVLPRFLNPDKKKAGGRETFMKFTGLNLAEGTSMGISIIGEAYGNYNVYGGILFMGIWGWFLAWIWRGLLKRTKQNVLLLAFLPLIFLQVVKAETELVVVLNHLVKASIVVFLFFWATRQFLGWNFTPRTA